jgi:hypothetical protein
MMRQERQSAGMGRGEAWRSSEVDGVGSDGGAFIRGVVDE